MRELLKKLQLAVGFRRTDNCLIQPEYDPSLIANVKVKSLMEKGCIKHIPLSQARFVVFDLETTGFHPYAGDEIISISGLIVENGQIDHNNIFDTLVNPGRLIPPEVTSLTGITNEMVCSAPPPLVAIDQFLTFARQSVLVAHNSDFDMHFLNLKLRQYCQSKVYHPVIDTFALSNIIFSHERKHTLDHMIAVLNLSGEGRHTSLGDAFITADLLTIMLNKLPNRGITTVQELVQYLRWRSAHH